MVQQAGWPMVQELQQASKPHASQLFTQYVDRFGSNNHGFINKFM
jgi:hypothetical protein